MRLAYRTAGLISRDTISRSSGERGCHEPAQDGLRRDYQTQASTVAYGNDVERERGERPVGPARLRPRVELPMGQGGLVSKQQEREPMSADEVFGTHSREESLSRAAVELRYEHVQSVTPAEGIGFGRFWAAPWPGVQDDQAGAVGMGLEPDVDVLVDAVDPGIQPDPGGGESVRGIDGLELAPHTDTGTHVLQSVMAAGSQIDRMCRARQVWPPPSAQAIGSRECQPDAVRDGPNYSLDSQRCTHAAILGGPEHSSPEQRTQCGSKEFLYQSTKPEATSTGTPTISPPGSCRRRLTRLSMLPRARIESGEPADVRARA